MTLGRQKWAQTPRRATSPDPWRQSIPLSVMAGVVVFLGTVTQSPARFVHDAAVYWSGAIGLAHGRAQGDLDLRGVLTSMLYLPAALATRVFGDSSGGVAVLVENSVLVTLVGVLLLPRLLCAWGPVTSWTLWVCGGLTWLFVGRFAPYPLTDLWAAALILAAVVALQRGTAMGLMSAGLLTGIAFNVRPAYLVPLLLALAVVLVSQRLAGLWFAGGVVVALVPQSVVNIMRGAGWKPWPPDMFALTQLQAHNASFVVRYDTVYLLNRDPQQFFCSPAMAQVVGHHPPQSTGELAALYLHNLPQSIVFVAEKAAAALHWPLSAPYFAAPGARDQVFALLVTLVTVLGFLALVQAQSASGLRSAPLAVWAALAVWAGSLITIVTPSPETRFALPLVLFGIAGCATVVRGRLGSRWLAVACLAVALVFAIGTIGLSHPAAPGPTSPSNCATS